MFIHPHFILPPSFVDSSSQCDKQASVSIQMSAPSGMFATGRERDWSNALTLRRNSSSLKQVCSNMQPRISSASIFAFSTRLVSKPFVKLPLPEQKKAIREMILEKPTRFFNTNPLGGTTDRLAL
jgi:hypothetical protein